MIPVGTCLTIKGAEDVINRPFAFELSTHNDTFYFIADNDKVVHNPTPTNHARSIHCPFVSDLHLILIGFLRLRVRLVNLTFELIYGLIFESKKYTIVSIKFC